MRIGSLIGIWRRMTRIHYNPREMNCRSASMLQFPPWNTPLSLPVVSSLFWLDALLLQPPHHSFLALASFLPAAHSGGGVVFAGVIAVGARTGRHRRLWYLGSSHLPKLTPPIHSDHLNSARKWHKPSNLTGSWKMKMGIKLSAHPLLKMFSLSVSEL